MIPDVSHPYILSVSAALFEVCFKGYIVVKLPVWLVEPHYHFHKASTILSLEPDFLFSHPAALRHARHFTDVRRLAGSRKPTNRLYVVEATPSITGTNADHRLPLPSSHIESFARTVAGKMKLLSSQETSSPSHAPAEVFADSIARNLAGHRGEGLVIAGETQPPEVHALAHWINEKLDNTGKTVTYLPSAEARPVRQIDSIRGLSEDLQNNKVDLLLVLGGEPGFRCAR